MSVYIDEKKDDARILKKLLARWIANHETRQKAKLLLLNKPQLKKAITVSLRETV